MFVCSPPLYSTPTVENNICGTTGPRKWTNLFASTMSIVIVLEESAVIQYI